MRGFRFTTLAVVDGIFPNHLDDYDGYLISGSAYGVYDDILFHFATYRFNPEDPSSQKATFWRCFGHQIIAHALGGKAKWDKVGSWHVNAY